MEFKTLITLVEHDRPVVKFLELAVFNDSICMCLDGRSIFGIFVCCFIFLRYHAYDCRSFYG